MRYLNVFDDPYPDLEPPARPLAPVLELTVRYRLQQSISPRVLEVERQFSLGEIAEEFQVFRGFRLLFNDGDVIYITGESGGGKSTLLRAFKRLYAGSYVDMNLIDPDPDEVLVEGVGDDVSDALYLLNNAGLGEAWLFIRRYGELSDGQRYRYRLAKAIYKARRLRARALVCDEFCSTLDRITAKVVAFLTQKLARRFGFTLVVATAHGDLLEDLNPDILIVKPVQKPPLVKRFKPTRKPCSLMSEITIEPGEFRDFMRLEVYHYKGFRPAFVKYVFKATYRGELVGVIVYTGSNLSITGRRVVFGSHLKDMVKRGEVLRISRVVVAPRFRGIGLGTRLVRETLAETGAKVVEALAAMAVYNPFFEKAGMRLGYTYEPRSSKYFQPYRRLLEKYGFNPERLHSYSHLKSVIDGMSDETLRRFELELSEVPLVRINKTNIKIRSMLKTGSAPRSRLPVYMMQYSVFQIRTYYYYWVSPAHVGELLSTVQRR